MRTKIDLKGTNHSVIFEYESEIQLEPDIGSIMQINRLRFKVLECTYLESYPKTLLIKGELL